MCPFQFHRLIGRFLVYTPSIHLIPCIKLITWSPPLCALIGWSSVTVVSRKPARAARSWLDLEMSLWRMRESHLVYCPMRFDCLCGRETNSWEVDTWWCCSVEKSFFSSPYIANKLGLERIMLCIFNNVPFVKNKLKSSSIWGFERILFIKVSFVRTSSEAISTQTTWLFLIFSN